MDRLEALLAPPAADNQPVGAPGWLPRGRHDALPPRQLPAPDPSPPAAEPLPHAAPPPPVDRVGGLPG
eukprot:1176188-Alexandrium_andersonii.AAC.1